MQLKYFPSKHCTITNPWTCKKWKKKNQLNIKEWTQCTFQSVYAHFLYRSKRANLKEVVGVFRKSFPVTAHKRSHSDCTEKIKWSNSLYSLVTKINARFCSYFFLFLLLFVLFKARWTFKWNNSVSEKDFPLSCNYNRHTVSLHLQ